MDKNESSQRRKHARYETDVTIAYRVPYDFRAEVDFRVNEEVMEGREKKYIGYSRDISVEGLAFVSNKHLQPDDVLLIELHLPKSRQIVFMQGEACWCMPAGIDEGGHRIFKTGVHISKVDGKDVEQTIYFDKSYGIEWSDLLERVLGGFAKTRKKK